MRDSEKAPTGRKDFDTAGAACRNAEIALAELSAQLRSLRFRRERFSAHAGCGTVFTDLTLALHHLDCAQDNLREAADGFYADSPDVYWTDENGRLHFYDQEEESE